MMQAKEQIMTLKKQRDQMRAGGGSLPTPGASATDSSYADSDE